FGFYENAFRVMQLCYAELNRAPDAPLANWQDAFKPHSFVAVEELVNDTWKKWTTNFPTNDDVPGDGQALLPMWDYVVMGLGTMHEMFENSPESHANVEQPGVVAHGLGPILEHLVKELGIEALTVGGQLLMTAQHLAEWMSKDAEQFAAWLSRESNPILKWIGEHLGSAMQVSGRELEETAQHFITMLLKAFIDWYWDQIKDRVADDATTRHRWVNLNLFYGNLQGMIQDQLLSRGFDAINDLDYRAWLTKYLREDNGLTLSSPIVASVYNALFAYEDGDTRMQDGEPYPPKANLEAGTALRAGIRQFMTYKGAIMWKMQAGMGDVVFAPLYEVLKRRGVKFKFFHRVKQLIPSPDKNKIERIVIARQVDLNPQQAAQGEYDPLVQVNGLPCWPNEPLYGQLVDGEKLKQDRVDLESYCYDWKDVEEITLKADEDFDAVVLGIPIGALPYICSDLINASDKWLAMLNNVKTVRTQAFQLWLKPTAFDLGWTPMQQPVLTSLDISHLNTWADMSHLIPREAWPSDAYPLNIAYFCGPQTDDQPLEPSPHGPIQTCEQMDQQAANDRVKQRGVALLNNHIGDLWPRAVVKDPGGQQCFKQDLLVNLHSEGHPDQPFDGQYWHANVTPSERYTLSVAGSSKYRLPAHSDDEFTNLYLAGDWTANGMNVGCVEATVMSGMLASHALSGYPAHRDIFGLDLELP
ncbi:MAG TPA: FAD-dependent oxidoreductase, partial [Anaerolineae bacterium]